MSRSFHFSLCRGYSTTRDNDRIKMLTSPGLVLCYVEKGDGCGGTRILLSFVLNVFIFNVDYESVPRKCL